MPKLERSFRELDPVLQRHGHQAHGLIEVLNRGQQLYGHLSEPLLRHIARQLQLPFSRVMGTASFYHLFRFQPAARHRSSHTSTKSKYAITGLFSHSCPVFS